MAMRTSTLPLHASLSSLIDLRAWFTAWLKALILLTCALAFSASATEPSQAQAAGKKVYLGKYLKKVPADKLVAGATAYGAIDSALPIVPIFKGNETLGYAFITSDLVGTTGYSGKPIHVLVALGLDGKLLRAELVDHSEPIVLIGIPNSKIKALTEAYSGLDIIAEANAGGLC